MERTDHITEEQIVTSGEEEEEEEEDDEEDELSGILACRAAEKAGLKLLLRTYAIACFACWQSLPW